MSKLAQQKLEIEYLMRYVEDRKATRGMIRSFAWRDIPEWGRIGHAFYLWDRYNNAPYEERAAQDEREARLAQEMVDEEVSELATRPIFS